MEKNNKCCNNSCCNNKKCNEDLNSYTGSNTGKDNKPHKKSATNNQWC